MTAIPGLVLLALSAAGCVYALLAALLVRRFARQPPATPVSGQPAITLLKPLHGADASLAEDLRTFCAQDYRGDMQIVFGVQRADDPAVQIVQRLMCAFPERDWLLVIAPDASRAEGNGCNQACNPKVANLVHMSSAIRHDIVILSDADIVVDRGYAGRVASLLQQPGVGAVTCLYYGIADANPWSRLAAMAIDYHFLPAVLIGLTLGLATPCFGSTIALRRADLERLGGFGAVAHELADDYALGAAIRRLGLRVAVAPFVVGHRCIERSGGALLRHELRWARTVRTIDPWGFAGSIVSHPLPLAAAGWMLMGGGWPAGLALAAAALCRGILMLSVDDALSGPGRSGWMPQADRGLPRGPRRVLLGVLRDFLSCFVLFASFFGHGVDWRGRRYRVRRDGTIIQAKGSNP